MYSMLRHHKLRHTPDFDLDRLRPAYRCTERKIEDLDLVTEYFSLEAIRLMS